MPNQDQALLVRVIALDGKRPPVLDAVRDAIGPVMPVDAAVLPAVDLRGRNRKVHAEFSDDLSFWAWASMAGGQLASDMMPSGGGVGCYFSHVKAWQACADAGTPMLVLEDDVRLVDADRLRTAVAALGTDGGRDWGFDVAFLMWQPLMGGPRGAVAADGFLEWTPDPDAPGGGGRFYSSAAYVVTSKGARRLLARWRPIELQLDTYMASEGFRTPPTGYERLHALFLTGGNGSRSPASVFRARLAAASAGSTIQVVGGVSHLLPFECVPAFVSTVAIAAFVLLVLLVAALVYIGVTASRARR